MQSIGKSGKLMDSSSKQVPEQIDENNDETDSLDRDPSYSEDFLSSHKSAKTEIKSQKNL